MITNGAAAHESVNNCTTSVCTEPSSQGPQIETPLDSSVATVIPSPTAKDLDKKARGRANSAAYRKNHREKILHKKRASYRADPQHFKDTNAKWRRANPERSKQLRRDGDCRLRERLLEFYGRACATCGHRDSDVLDLDHVHGDGSKHREQGLHSYTIYRQILSGDLCRDDYRLLCRNCNWKAWLNSLRGRVISSV